jgi:hypothetical protein
MMLPCIVIAMPYSTYRHNMTGESQMTTCVQLSRSAVSPRWISSVCVAHGQFENLLGLLTIMESSTHSLSDYVPCRCSEFDHFSQYSPS